MRTNSSRDFDYFCKILKDTKKKYKIFKLESNVVSKYRFFEISSKRSLLQNLKEFKKKMYVEKSNQTRLISHISHARIAEMWEIDRHAGIITSTTMQRWISNAIFHFHRLASKREIPSTAAGSGCGGGGWGRGSRLTTRLGEISTSLSGRITGNET